MLSAPSHHRPYPNGRFDEFFAEFERLSRQAFTGSAAVPVSVWSNDEAIAITVELPGIAKEQLQIEATCDSLTISGERQTSAGEGTWLSRERQTGGFNRTISLPWRIDPDRVEARLKDGILTVALRRSESDKPRKIAVAA